MADQHQSRAQALQFAFQPFDGRQVEMVGRLVEQQNVGLRRQHPGERRAARLAAGKVFRIFRAGQAQLVEQIMRAVIGRRWGRGRRRHSRTDVRKAGKIRLLRQIAHGRVGLEEAPAVVGLDLAGGDFQQRRFARAIASDKTEPVAALDGEVGGFDQGLAAKSKADALQGENGRSHARIKRKMAARASVKSDRAP